MHLRLLGFVIGILCFSDVWSQKAEPIYVNGFYIIQDKVPYKKGDCLFCNPATMPDRIVLDSAKKMIAKKTTFPDGYTYYEWRKTNYEKSYEEIQINSRQFKDITFYTDSGPSRKPPQGFTGFWTFYFRYATNTKQRYNGLYIAEKVRFEITQRERDSLLVVYKSLKSKITKGTQFWMEYNFYENGKLKSSGITITGVKETASNSEEIPNMDSIKTPENVYRIGPWAYYETSGEPNSKEVIYPIRKIN